MILFNFALFLFVADENRRFVRTETLSSCIPTHFASDARCF